jgi:hypothetical protein
MRTQIAKKTLQVTKATMLVCLLLFICFVFTGCSTYELDLKTGKVTVWHTSNWQDAEFMDEVQDNIKQELKNPYPSYYSECATWQEFWISYCENLHYSNPPGKDEPYIQYVIARRREALLPDIPEINNRKFRSLWRKFTDRMDEELTNESNCLQPPSQFDGKQLTKTWPEFWKFTEEGALRFTPVSTNGIEYINNRRKQMKLKPLDYRWDGSSINSPFVVSADDGIAATGIELDFVNARYGNEGKDWKFKQQRRESVGYVPYEILTVQLNDGSVKTFYFDVSNVTHDW